MSVKIRLRRMGTRGKPFYRIVVADSRTSRDGRFIDLLGYYDPRTEPPTIKIDEEKAVLWLNRGAQPSDTAEALLKKQSIFAGVVSPVSKPRPERPRKESPTEEAAEEPKAEEVAEAPEGEEVTEEVEAAEVAEATEVEEVTEEGEAEPAQPESVVEEAPAAEETEAEVEEERQSEEQG